VPVAGVISCITPSQLARAVLCCAVLCLLTQSLLQGLQKLNAVGYGQPGSGLKLDLVYNPGGAFLAPSQTQLEPAYKQELQEVRTHIQNSFDLRALFIYTKYNKKYIILKYEV
jgi:hypothetical protein